MRNVEKRREKVEKLLRSMYQRIQAGDRLTASTYGETFFSYVETFPSSSFASFPNIFLLFPPSSPHRKKAVKIRNYFSIEIFIVSLLLIPWSFGIVCNFYEGCQQKLRRKNFHLTTFLQLPKQNHHVVHLIFVSIEWISMDFYLRSLLLLRFASARFGIGKFSSLLPLFFLWITNSLCINGKLLCFFSCYSCLPFRSTFDSLIIRGLEKKLRKIHPLLFRYSS